MSSYMKVIIISVTKYTLMASAFLKSFNAFCHRLTLIRHIYIYMHDWYQCFSMVTCTIRRGLVGKAPGRKTEGPGFKTRSLL